MSKSIRVLLSIFTATAVLAFGASAAFAKAPFSSADLQKIEQAKCPNGSCNKGNNNNGNSENRLNNNNNNNNSNNQTGDARYCFRYRASNKTGKGTQDCYASAGTCEAKRAAKGASLDSKGKNFTVSAACTQGQAPALEAPADTTQPTDPGTPPGTDEKAAAIDKAAKAVGKSSSKMSECIDSYKTKESESSASKQVAKRIDGLKTKQNDAFMTYAQANHEKDSAKAIAGAKLAVTKADAAYNEGVSVKAAIDALASKDLKSENTQARQAAEVAIQQSGRDITNVSNAYEGKEQTSAESKSINTTISTLKPKHQNAVAKEASGDKNKASNLAQSTEDYKSSKLYAEEVSRICNNLMPRINALKAQPTPDAADLSSAAVQAANASKTAAKGSLSYAATTFSSFMSEINNAISANAGNIPVLNAITALMPELANLDNQLKGFNKDLAAGEQLLTYAVALQKAALDARNRGDKVGSDTGETKAKEQADIAKNKFDQVKNAADAHKAICQADRAKFQGIIKAYGKRDATKSFGNDPVPTRSDVSCELPPDCSNICKATRWKNPNQVIRKGEAVIFNQSNMEWRCKFPKPGNNTREWVGAKGIFYDMNKSSYPPCASGDDWGDSACFSCMLEDQSLPIHIHSVVYVVPKKVYGKYSYLCPSGGATYDGANCLLGTPPGTPVDDSGKLHSEQKRTNVSKFRYKPSNPPANGPCPEGDGFDGQYCIWAKAPNNWKTFIWGGNYYTESSASPSCSR